MKDAYPRFQALGAEVVAISFSPPERLAPFLAEFPLPFPLLSDPALTAYRYFATAHTSLLGFLRPGVLVHFLRLLVRGWLPGKPTRGDDLFQLGGDFILDAAGRLLYAHASRDAADRPSVDDLLAPLK